MKYVLSVITLLLLTNASTLSAQSTLDKLILEDAQKAYTSGRYDTCLKKVGELETKGVKGLVILHLKIMAASKMWPSTLSNEQMAQFKKDIDYYLKTYDNEDFLKQYREVYEVSKKLSLPEYTGGMTLEQFQEILKEERFVFVSFTAKWSAPCRIFKENLQTIEPELRDNKVLTLKLDADSSRILMNSLEIKFWPSYFLYDNGALLWSGNGARSIEEVKAIILEKINGN